MKTTSLARAVSLPLFLALTLFVESGPQSSGEQPRAGAIDPSFDPGAGIGSDGSLARVLCLAVQEDGKILIGGSFSRVNGQSRTHLARLNPDGSIDSEFSPRITHQQSAFTEVRKIAVQPDGRVLFAGKFDSVNGLARSGLARLLPDGAIDLSFTPRISFGDVSDVWILADRRILICGFFSISNDEHGEYRSDIARLNENGSLDPTFDIGNLIFGFVHGIALDLDGGFYARGFFTAESPDSNRRNLIRFGPAGTVDPVFAPKLEPFAQVEAMLVQPGESGLVVVGRFSQINGLTRYGAARVLSTGEVDPQFVLGNGKDQDLSSGGMFHALASQPDGKLLVAGDFRHGEFGWKTGLGRFHRNGTPDGSFTFVDFDTSGLGGAVIGLQGDGRILVAGSFRATVGRSYQGLLRLLGDSPQGPSQPEPSITPYLRHRLLPNGALQLSIEGSRGRRVRVLSSTDLRHWAPLSSSEGDGDALVIPSDVYRFVPRQFFQMEIAPE